MNERKDVEVIFEVIMVEIFPDMMRHGPSNLETLVNPN